MTWWSQKDWAIRFSHPDGPTSSKDLVEKITHRYPEDPDFCGEDGLRSPILEGSVWWLILLMGPIILWPKEKILRWWWPIWADWSVWLIYDVMQDPPFYGVENSLFIAMRLNWRLVDQPLENLLIASNVSMLEKNDWGTSDLGMDSLGIQVYRKCRY